MIITGAEDEWDTKGASQLSIEVSAKYGFEPILINQKQDTLHHGTTVWDSSKVLLTYFERKLSTKGKWLELGAGCGLLGITLARMGVDIVMTDQEDIVPLLQSNVDQNMRALTKMTVKPLCWRNKDHLENIGVYDTIVATDVVYCYELIEPLLQTIIAVSRKGTEIFIGHEIRDDEVYDKFLTQIKATDAFTNVRKLSLPKYKHPDNIVLLRFSRK